MDRNDEKQFPEALCDRENVCVTFVPLFTVIRSVDETADPMVSLFCEMNVTFQLKSCLKVRTS